MTRRAWVLPAVAAAGIPAAAVWLWLGEPAQWLGTERGLVLTESAARGQFQVVAVFTLIGMVVGVVSGPLVHRLTRPGRWQDLLALAAAAGAASLVCWRLGVALGPDSPRDATGVEVLQTVPASFAVDALAPFLVWPLSAVLSYTLAMYLSHDGADREDEHDQSAGVSDR